MWIEIKNPSQELLDELMAEARNNISACHDCGVKPGEAHLDNCDVSRCKVCKGQRLQCECEGGGGDIWTGIWPGIEEAYKWRLVTRWGEKGEPRFNINRVAEIGLEKEYDFSNGVRGRFAGRGKG